MIPRSHSLRESGLAHHVSLWDWIWLRFVLLVLWYACNCQQKRCHPLSHFVTPWSARLFCLAHVWHFVYWSPYEASGLPFIAKCCTLCVSGHTLKRLLLCLHKLSLCQLYSSSCLLFFLWPPKVKSQNPVLTSTYLPAIHLSWFLPPLMWPKLSQICPLGYCSCSSLAGKTVYWLRKGKADYRRSPVKTPGVLSLE